MNRPEDKPVVTRGGRRRRIAGGLFHFPLRSGLQEGLTVFVDEGPRIA